MSLWVPRVLLSSQHTAQQQQTHSSSKTKQLVLMTETLRVTSSAPDTVRGFCPNAFFCMPADLQLCVPCPSLHFAKSLLAPLALHTAEPCAGQRQDECPTPIACALPPLMPLHVHTLGNSAARVGGACAWWKQERFTLQQHQHSSCRIPYA